MDAATTCSMPCVRGRNKHTRTNLVREQSLGTRKQVHLFISLHLLPSLSVFNPEDSLGSPMTDAPSLLCLPDHGLEKEEKRSFP